MKTKIGAILFLIAVVSVPIFHIYSIEAKDKMVQDGLHPAQFYEKAESSAVRCLLCLNRCSLSDGQIGKCRARKNIKGDLYSLVYGKIASAHVDPIEKKPFFHFLPGEKAYSIATTGCNLQCKFCQNWQISQVFPWDVDSAKMSAQGVVDAALKSGSKAIAYTYNEPTVYYEYMMDIAKIARQKGLKNIVVSSGYINPEPLIKLLPYIDAYKIDLKGFDEKFYERMTGGKIEPVLQAMKIIKENGVWLEIVNLVIPTENDSTDEIKGLILWIKNNLGPDVPVHFTGFHPDYKIQNLPPTPVETLKKVRAMALRLGLNYVYTGNARYSEGESTYCPKSKDIVIERKGFFIVSNKLKDGRCPNGEKIPGVWK